MHRVRLVVEGRVQGVGFRWFVVRRAEALGLTGVVENRSDGGVEVEAEGERNALEQLIEALRVGPSSARVTAIHEQWESGPARHRAFRITG